jgi:flagellin
MAVINTNVNALFAQNALNNTGKLQSTAMQQLSSGLRINSARDDAAGMAIATRMTNQIRGLNQAISNSNDAVTLVQTAEGATSSITNMMQRMRELALEASNGTQDDTQRGYLDLEFQQLKQQIVDISNQTEWNGFPVLNGTAGQRVGEMPVYKATSNNLSGSVFINPTTARTIAGANSGAVQTLDFSAALPPSGVQPSAGTINISWQSNGQTYTQPVTITATDAANGSAGVLTEIQNTLNQSQYFGGNTGRTATVGTSGTNYGKVALSFNNTDGQITGLTVSTGSVVNASPAVSVSSNQLAVNNSTEQFSNNGKFLQTGALTVNVTYPTVAGTVTPTLTANFLTTDNKNIALTGSFDATTGAIVFSPTAGQNNLVISDKLTYTIRDSSGSAVNLNTADRNLSLSVDVQGSIPTLSSGDLIINGTVIGPSKAADDTLSPLNNAAGSAIAKAAAINRAAVPQGVTQPEVQSLTVNGTPSPGTITVAGVSVVITSSDTTPAAVAQKIAMALQGSAQFSSTTGRAISVAQGSNMVTVTYPVSDGSVANLDFSAGSTGMTGVSNVVTPYATSVPGTGVYAKVNENVVTGQAMNDSSVSSGVVYINGYASADITTVLNNPQATRANVVKAINQISSETGVKAIDSGLDDKGVTLVAADGRNIEVSFQTSDNANVFGAAIGLKEGVQCSTISLESKIQAPIVLTSAPNGNIANVGLDAGDYSKNQSVLNTAPRAAAMPATAQVESINIGTPTAGSSISVLINGTSFPTGVAVAGTTAQTMATTLVNAINADSTLGVFASYGETTGQILLTARVPGTPFTMSLTSTPATLASTQEVTPNAAATNAPLTPNDLVINGVAIRQSVAADDTYSNTMTSSSDPASSAIAIAAAINASSSQTGVTAQANPVVSQGTNTNTFGPTGPQTLNINGVNVQVDFVNGESGADRRAKVVAAINALQGRSGVSATDNGSGVTLSSDGRNMSVSFDSSVSGLSAASFGLDKGGSVAQVSKIALSATTATSASVMINGVNITATHSGGGGVTPVDIAAAINAQTNPTLDVTATLEYANGTSSPATAVLVTANVPGNSFDMRGAAVAAGSTESMTLSTVTQNSVGNNDVTPVNMSTAYSTNVLGGGSALNNVATMYGTVKLVAAAPMLPGEPGADGISPDTTNISGTPISITTGSNGVGSQSNFSALGFQEGGFGGRASEDMDPPKVGRLSFQVGAGANQTVTIDLPDFGSGGTITGDITGDVNLPVNQRTVRINTMNGATAVLNMLDASMDKINAVRATMGAVMNRLDYAVSNLTNVSNNMTTSRSAIQDADYASASTNLAKAQIMQQAATAVLAQANTSQQTVLKLLGG